MFRAESHILFASSELLCISHYQSVGMHNVEMKPTVAFRSSPKSA